MWDFVANVKRGYVCRQVLGSSPVLIITSALHTHSVLHNRRCMLLVLTMLLNKTRTQKDVSPLLKTQFVLRYKHLSSWLQNPISL
jgi:hypothetical protein